MKRDQIRGTSRGFHYRRNGRRTDFSESGKIDGSATPSVVRRCIAIPKPRWAVRFIELDLADEKARQLQKRLFLSRIVVPTSAVLLRSFARQQRRRVLSPTIRSLDDKGRAAAGRLIQGCTISTTCWSASLIVIRPPITSSREVARERAKARIPITHERHFGPARAGSCGGRATCL